MTELPTADADPLVSVIVPTKNSAATLEACLDSVARQTYRALEVIVVDNHSSDQTASIAQQMGATLFDGGPERSAQRNLGIARSRGDYVLWLDSDMMLLERAVERAVAQAEATGAAGVFIPERSTGQGFWAHCRTLERLCLAEEETVLSPRLVRRSYLLQTGGFVEWLSGTEDAELRMRMRRDGSVLAWSDVAVLHDEGRPALRVILAKRYYYGLGLPGLTAADPAGVRSQLRAQVTGYVRNWRRLARHPALAAGVIVMRAAEFGAYLTGAAVGWARGAGSTRRMRLPRAISEPGSGRRTPGSPPLGSPSPPAPGAGGPAGT
jgi:glycosyltransferase involved in cell wall biosynthesis